MTKRTIENSTVLVTGGAGFIGSNLIEALLNQNNKVVCFDNFSTGKRYNIKNFLNHPNFQLIEGDLRNYEDCEKAVKGVQYILHQAALGSVPRSIKDPVTTTEVNINGFVNMLTAAKNEGVKRFVYASSSSVYGDHPDLPKVEEKTGNPLSPYAITKHVNELFALNFSNLYGIETIGLRYFNVFGKQQDPEGAYAAVIPMFLKALINHESPIINGDGTHSRDFTYIANVVQINQLAALTENTKAVNTVYNVAFGGNTNLNELFDALKNALIPFDSSLENMQSIHGEERPGDIKHSLASINRAKELLDYKPIFDIEQGIKESVRWYWEYFN